MGADTKASTVGNFGTATQAFGVGYATVGAYNKAKADKAALEYQAGVDRNNAQLAEWQAQDALARGQSAVDASRLKTASLKGSQRARLAANGVALDEGSALNILEDTDYMGDLDAAVISDNAKKEAWGIRTQGANYSSNADLLAARANAESPFGSAAGTLLTGAGAVADSWYRRRTATG